MIPWRAIVIMLGGFITLAAISAGQAAGPKAPTAAAQTPFMVEYFIPIPNSEPRHIAVEEPGKVWFTLYEANAIGSLEVTSPTNYDFDIYPLPTPDSEPYDLVLDDTAVWFTEHNNNRIGRLERTTGAITEYVIPTANSRPRGIDIAPDGTLWFAESATNTFAQLNPVTGVITETTYPTGGAILDDVAVAGNNSIWVTAANSNPSLHRVFEYRPSTGTYINVPVANFMVPPFPPGHLTLAANGFPWLSAPTKDLVGLYAPGTLALWRWHKVPTEGAFPLGIEYRREDGHNVVYFTETVANRVGRLDIRPSGRRLYILDQPLPTPNGAPFGIDVDDRGTAWITAPGTNRIVTWEAPYFFFTYLPATVR